MNELLYKLSELFETELNDLDTKIESLDSWDSLTSLSIIALASEDYDVEISNNDIIEAVTIGGLINLIESKSLDK
jgi:acyl carrier protein